MSGHRATPGGPSLFSEVESALAALEAEIQKLVEAGHLTFADRDKQLPEPIRDKLLVLGASLHDCVFWVRRRAQEGDLGPNPGDQMFWAQEMEAGTGAWGVTMREALDHYFSDDLLDHGRWHDWRGIDYEADA